MVLRLQYCFEFVSYCNNLLILWMLLCMLLQVLLCHGVGMLIVQDAPEVESLDLEEYEDELSNRICG